MPYATLEFAAATLKGTVPEEIVCEVVPPLVVYCRLAGPPLAQPVLLVT